MLFHAKWEIPVVAASDRLPVAHLFNPRSKPLAIGFLDPVPILSRVRNYEPCLQLDPRADLFIFNRSPVLIFPLVSILR